MLTSLALLFIGGLTLGYLFNLIKLPSLLGMLLAGIALGPYGLNLLDETLLSISLELRQIALIIILMRAGLALKLGELKQVGRAAILMCFVPACFEIAGVMLIAPRLLGISLIEAAVLGSVLAAVSPAVIVPKMLRLMDERVGTQQSIPQMIMAAGSVDDVFVIVLFSSFTLLAMGGEFSALSLTQIPISIVMGLILGVLSGLILAFVFRRVHLRDSLKILILLSVSFLFLGLENMLKGTLAI